MQPATSPGAKFNIGRDIPGAAPRGRFIPLRDPLAGSLLREEIGFEPAFSLKQGIEAYARWMRLNAGITN